MHDWRMFLTLITLTHIGYDVFLHERPPITLASCFVCKRSTTCVAIAASFVDFKEDIWDPSRMSAAQVGAQI